MHRDEYLRSQGWTRQFLTDEPRLSEMVEEYRTLGFEVLLEPVELSEEGGECTACLKLAPERFRVIWTRPKTAGGASDLAS